MKPNSSVYLVEIYVINPNWQPCFSASDYDDEGKERRRKKGPITNWRDNEQSVLRDYYLRL